MKYIYNLFILLALGIVSCGSSNNGDDVRGDIKFEVNPEAVNVTNEATTATVTVKATASWNISSDADWCTVFPEGGIANTAVPVTLTIKANGGQSARTATLTVRASGSAKTITVTQAPKAGVTLSATALTAGAQGGESKISITSNTVWTAVSDQPWCTVTPDKGADGTTDMTVKLDANSGSDRVATVTVSYAGGNQTVAVTQLSDIVDTPDGYHLVWADEFNDAGLRTPDEKKWWYEVWAPGYVNNELQRYVAGKQGDNYTAEIINGILNIRAIKVGNEVISARVNTSESWQYGYFEARMRIPRGKGTWPAFWMMPKANGSWPRCGEIDIMEEVGYNPNYIVSTIHCDAYNHVKGTQRTADVLVPTSQDEFHVYALEWTADYIRTYVDGKLLLTFNNDKKNDEATWPFNKPFYLKLNLAWGGDWGGAQGVDESILPATFQIDYVRVFQK